MDNVVPADWVAVRGFRLAPDADRAEVIRFTEDVYVPLLREMEGFVSYYVLRPADDAWVSVTVWRDQAAAEAAAPALRDWMAANVAQYIADDLDRIEGTVDVTAFADGIGAATPTA